MHTEAVREELERAINGIRDKALRESSNAP